jgi:hypothetical protein
VTIRLAAQMASFVGAFLALLGYVLISIGRMSGSTPSYHFLNLAAGVLLAFSSVVIFNPGYILLNAACVSIAAVTLARLLVKGTSRAPVARGLPPGRKGG